MLDAGCTRYAAGEGAVYTRSVEVNSKLFHLEGRSRATRKRILREELAGLQAAIEQLQQVSQQRQLRENERKVRFQALQQQQLQQQLHLQQQTVLAAQQQHQMLLKMIDEQAHQRNGTAAAPAAKKSKPKAPKIPVRDNLILAMFISLVRNCILSFCLETLTERTSGRCFSRQARCECGGCGGEWRGDGHSGRGWHRSLCC